VPAAKRMSYRVMNKIRPFKRKSRSASYITDLQLHPDGPLGLRTLPEPQLASLPVFFIRPMRKPPNTTHMVNRWQWQCVCGACRLSFGHVR
jgi:hypothetical protein